MPRSTRSFVRRAALAAAFTLALATCSEPTGPKNVLDITLEALPGIVTNTSSDGENPGITCTVPIRATATGPGRAFWLSSTLRWFAGPTRSEPFDTASFPAEVMAYAFGFIDMTGGQQQELQVQIGFPLPFEWELEARYNVGEAIKSTSIRLHCGPVPPSGAIAAPYVEAPSVLGRELLRPGDTLTVLLHMSSPYALWRTHLSLSGPVERDFYWAERGAATQWRTQNVIVPPDAVLDAALVATLTVVDALGVEVSRETITTKVVTDREPPVLASARFADWNGFALPGRLKQFGTGDTLAVRFRASDDLGLAQLVYEAEGPGVAFRDSVPFSAIADSTAYIRVDARWAGVERVSVYVRDRAQRRSVNTVVSPADSLRFFPTVVRPSSQVTVGEHWASGTHDGPRQKLYFPARESRIDVVDAAGAVMQSSSIAMPAIPAGLDVSAAGDSLFVALLGLGIAIVDLRGSSPVTTVIPMTASPAAGGAAVRAYPADVKRDAAGRWVVWATLDGTNEQLSMYFDPVARTFTHIPRDVGPMQQVYVSQFFLIPSQDRSSMVVTQHDCVRLYRSSAARFSPCRPMLPWSPAGTPAPSFSADGDLITIGHGAYDSTLAIAAEQGLARPTVTTTIVHSADGTTRWVVENDHVDRVRVSDGHRLERTHFTGGARRVWVSDDGAFLFIVDQGTTRLTRIDLR